MNIIASNNYPIAMSLYRIAGAITFLLISINAFGITAIPGWFLGIFALLAAIGLAAGV